MTIEFKQALVDALIRENPNTDEKVAIRKATHTYSLMYQALLNSGYRVGTIPEEKRLPRAHHSGQPWRGERESLHIPSETLATLSKLNSEDIAAIIEKNNERNASAGGKLKTDMKIIIRVLHSQQYSSEI